MEKYEMQLLVNQIFCFHVFKWMHLDYFSPNIKENPETVFVFNKLLLFQNVKYINLKRYLRDLSFQY